MADLKTEIRALLRVEFNDYRAIPYSQFNLFVAIVNNFEKYQTTGLIFADNNDKAVKGAILSGNILKGMESQMKYLVPNGFERGNRAFSTFYISTPLEEMDVYKFIYLCTMGYLKQGDIVTSTVAPYFAYPETSTQIYNRIKALSVNNVPPSFVSTIMGTDWNGNTLPTGAMVIKVIKDCLVEADIAYQKSNPSGQGQGY